MNEFKWSYGSDAVHNLKQMNKQTKRPLTFMIIVRIIKTHVHIIGIFTDSHDLNCMFV